MPAFDQHAFISYAHIDNEPMEAGEPGWVSRFHAGLQVKLSQRLGERARIWRDQKLAGNDVFGDEIIDRIGQSALLVSILTPRYLRSDWCTRELSTFAEVAAHSGGVQIGNKSRVVAVKKTPLDPATAVPELIERTLCKAFCDDADGASVEIDPALGEAVRQEFLRRISELAVEMADSLRAIAQATTAAGEGEAVGDGAVPGQAPGLVVYVAECGRDLRDARDQLIADLRLHGHGVLPSQQLPQTEADLRREVAADLARSAVSVHLVGASAGFVPDGPSGQTGVMLQNELAAARSRESGLKRLIWLPDGVQGERPPQQAFIDALLQDASLQQGADLLRGELEAFKAGVHHVLQQLQQTTAPPPASAPDATPTVHLLMTEDDRVAAVPLIKALKARGLAVTLPVFTGDAAQVRALNAQLVSASQAVLVCYAQADEAWKVHQGNDLRKQVATGAAPPRSRLLLLPPASPDKALLQALGEPDTVDLLAGLSDPVLDALVAGLALPGQGQ